jgi:hypothetical protein
MSKITSIMLLIISKLIKTEIERSRCCSMCQNVMSLDILDCSNFHSKKISIREFPVFLLLIVA